MRQWAPVRDGRAAGGWRFPLPLRLGVVLLGVAPSVLVPATAQADENVSSSYGVYCGVFRQEDGSLTSEDPAGVAFDGQRNDAAASPAEHTARAGSTAIYPAAAPYGEDCEAVTEFRDRLTVGAGSSGLADGAQVEVEVTVRLDSALDIAYGNGDFISRARYIARTSLRSLDDCPPGPEGPWCDVPARFNDDHEHYVYRYDGAIDGLSERDHSFTTNTGVDVGGWTDETDQADPTEVQVFTGTARLTVGHRYDLVGYLNAFTQAYDQVGLRATATVDELSFAIAPTASSAGVELAWASAGGGAGGGEPEDDVAPEVDAGITPAAVGGWHTGTPTIALSATDGGSGVASITYSTTGAVTTAPTVVDGALAEFSIGADGVTEVTYQAADVAGNVSSPQLLTIRRDTVAPLLVGLADITVAAPDGTGAQVTFQVGAQDALTPAPAVSCDRLSGSTFPVGRTQVSCRATDAAGNAATGGFTVTVTPPVLTAMDRLGRAVAALQPAPRIALTAFFLLADNRFDVGRVSQGCTTLATMRVFVLVLRNVWIVSASEARTLGELIDAARTEHRC